MDKQKIQAKIDAMQVELDGMKKLMKEKAGDWMPDKGDHYWVAMADGSAEEHVCYLPNIATSHADHGNLFKTRELAQAESDRRKLKTKIINTIAELNDGWEPDWSDHDQAKFYFRITLENGRNPPEVVVREKFWTESQDANSNLYLRSTGALRQLQSQYTAEELTAAYWA